MKKIFALLLIIGMGTMTLPSASINYAGGVNGDGYGKAEANVEPAFLAGSGNGGGYGKLDGDTILYWRDA